MILKEGKACNVGSVLMNKDVVERVTLHRDGKKRTFKIVARLKKDEDPKIVKAIFEENFGCGYGCGTVGIETGADTVTIDREKIHDREVFDLVVGMLTLAATL